MLMKPNCNNSLAPILGILALAFWSAACTKPPAAAAPTAQPGASPAVAVVQAKLEPLSRKIVLNGEFRPYQSADLHAKIAGYLRQITVDVGSRVREGDLIATLEVPELAAELAQATAERQRSEAELRRSGAEVEKAEANLRLTTVSHDRLAAASKAEPGLIAKQEIDEALARRDVASAQVSSTKSGVAVEEHRIAAARAAEQRIQTMSAYSKITAPFAGVITKRFADPGAMIQAGTASQTQALPVVRLADVSRLRLSVTVPQSAIPMIRMGQHVEVRVSALKKAFSGTLARETHDVLSASRTMEVEIDVPNSGGLLVPGMYAEVALTLEKRDKGLTIPAGSIINSGGNRSVLIVNSREEIEERVIKTGIETAASVEVVEGLAAADRVVISNRSLLRPGLKVEAKAAGSN